MLRLTATMSLKETKNLRLSLLKDKQFMTDTSLMARTTRNKKAKTINMMKKARTLGITKTKKKLRDSTMKTKKKSNLSIENTNTKCTKKIQFRRKSEQLSNCENKLTECMEILIFLQMTLLCTSTLQNLRIMLKALQLSSG